MKTAITISQNHELHSQPTHFERPERIQAIQTLLKNQDAMNLFSVIEARPASPEEVYLVHPEAYFQSLQRASEAGLVWLDSDTYSTPDSLRVAREALGGLLQVTEAVATGNADNAFALVRPPGHHARPSQAMGFCLFANIAIAARWLQQKAGIKRILIVDFDVHHGNGTQEIFYNDPDVMYISTHQAPLYPGTGALEEIGAGEGKKTTINIPLPANTGDDTLLYVFQEILSPRVKAFSPEFILVSAGYDSHWMDPIGGMNISVNGFGAIINVILTWAQSFASNQVVALLEGGYHTEALAHSVLTTLKLFSDIEAEPSDPFGQNPEQTNTHDQLEEYLTEVARFHAL